MRLVLPLVLLCACNPPTDDSGRDDTDVVPSASLTLTLSNVSSPGALVASDDSTHDIKIAPGIVIVHDASFSLFTEGQPATQAGLEALAEDGDPSTLVDALTGADGVSLVTFLSALDDTTYDRAPMLPGDSGTAVITVHADETVTMASMFGESNDCFVGTVGAGIALVAQDGTPVTGDVTSQLSLWDAGTEVNQEPGLGPDQAPRQAGPNTGASESEPVTKVEGDDDQGFAYPAVASYAKLVVAAD